jgi:hypothetical protein
MSTIHKVPLILAVLACVVCIVFLSGCTPASEPVLYENGDYGEEFFELLAHEAEFIALLNDFGLDWEISPRQRYIRERPLEDNFQAFFITCPEGLVSASFQLAEESLAIELGSKQVLSLSFFLDRVPTENEIDRLAQTGLLTDDEWNRFWELSGVLLDREDDVANVAERTRAFMEGYGRTIEHRTAEMPEYILEGLEGTVEYLFRQREDHVEGREINRIEFRLDVLMDSSEHVYYENDDYDDGYFELLADEIAFIAMLNDFGLDWEISPRQEHNSLRVRDDIQSYFIMCSDGLVEAFFQFAEGDIAISWYESRKWLELSFHLSREPTERELNRLHQTGLLSDDEWNRFWELSGVLLDMEEDVANISERARAFLEGYGRTIEHRTDRMMIIPTYILEGREGTVEYNFRLDGFLASGLLFRFDFGLGVTVD